METEESWVKIESIFVRHRNALMLRGQFTPIYLEYYLHLMEHGIRHTEALDQILKDGLAMMVLHGVARPWAETIAWTVSLRAPRMNLFLTSSSLDELVTGRIFTEDIREPDRNLFYSQTIHPEQAEPRVSTMQVSGKDPLDWVVEYYTQSEQRPARAFRLENEHFVLITAQPDCDLEWLEALDLEAVSSLLENEETKVLETRRFRFHCGCSVEKILPVLGSWREKLDELFQGEAQIQIQCPRCAAKYIVTPEMLLTSDN